MMLVIIGEDQVHVIFINDISNAYRIKEMIKHDFPSSVLDYVIINEEFFIRIIDAYSERLERNGIITSIEWGVGVCRLLTSYSYCC